MELNTAIGLGFDDSLANFLEIACICVFVAIIGMLFFLKRKG